MRKTISLRMIAKRIVRRVRYVFCLKELCTWKYESCMRCGHTFRLLWATTNEKWAEVWGDDGGCLCLDCFVEKALAKGIVIKSEDIKYMELFNPQD